MTPERKRYLASIDDEERVVRFYIKSIKDTITIDKRLLAAGETYSLIAGEFSVTVKADLAISKQMLSMLKKQLPQRWPKEKLKPCPFCGSGDVGLTTEFEEWEHYDETDWQEWHYVKCNGCDIELGRFYGEEEAVEAWNRRV